jgi:hypothetical protein
MQETARSRLDKMQLPADSDELPKVVKEQQDEMRAATRRMRELIDRPEQMAQKRSKRANSPMAPSAALVQFAVAYSAESDPLAKADLCSDCVRQVMPSMMAVLSETSAPEQIPMGQQFGEIIKHGIYTPLAAANTKEPPAMRVEVQRIIAATDDVIAGMEKEMQKRNEKSAPGLNRAVEAIRKNIPMKGKGAEKSKGKGKAKGHSSNAPARDADAECYVQARPPAPRIADNRSRFRQRLA